CAHILPAAILIATVLAILAIHASAEVHAGVHSIHSIHPVAAATILQKGLIDAAEEIANGARICPHKTLGRESGAVANPDRPEITEAGALAHAEVGPHSVLLTGTEACAPAETALA